MSAEELKAIFRRVFEEVYNQGKLNVADEIYAADYVLHNPASPEIRGPEALKQFFAMYRAAFPDLHYTVEDLIAEGDKVVARWTATGTHQGELMGIPPTGKQVVVTGISIVRITGGKIVEDDSNHDALGMLQQLGVIPAMGG